MYSTRQVAALLDLPVGQIREYARTGILSPERTERGAYRFGFRDLVVLRAATTLTEASVPHARVRRAFQRIKDQLHDGRELTEIRLSNNGDCLVACDGDALWEPESGQLQLTFDHPQAAPVACLDVEFTLEASTTAPIPAEEIEEADIWFNVARELEDPMPVEAEHAYRRALISNPFHVEAVVNLGRLLHIRGDLVAAIEQYRAAITIDSTSSIAGFNLGVALEEQGELEDAIQALEAAVSVQPGMADAHYNLGRLYERVGNRQAAVRHWSTYRRLIGS
jgi:tetratricopeptide (TPR) repeat protein